MVERHYGPACRYCCWISRAPLLGTDFFGPYLLEFVFEGTPETVARIQQRLAGWNIRSM